MKTKLKETCMTESAMQVQFEIGGHKVPARKIPEEEKRGEKHKKKKMGISVRCHKRSKVDSDRRPNLKNSLSNADKNEEK